MANKEINPTKTFAICTGVAFAISVIALLFMGAQSGKVNHLFTTDGALVLFDIAWMCALFGLFMGFIAWCGKRNQKMKEKDDINDLMRQYLEKKLREEEENGQ
ncbi:MAG: hypothetical protein NC043_02265 [Muribaculaceae bacterium]|nr:hypothetical protein [Muribaculaceae bacterium]